MSYREKIHSDDDSEDSDKEIGSWKRANKQDDDLETVENTKEESTSGLIQSNKRKRNTIWCDVLQDQLISEDLGSCLLKNKPLGYGSRGQESYDYTLKYAAPESKNDMDCSVPAEELSYKSEANSVGFSKKICKFVKLDNTQRQAANKIIKILSERKAYLIYRVVKEIGIEKAMNLLSMTEQIEENGGMMTLNNARRRTPGGVYFQLLKNDKDITKEMIDKIFEGEMNGREIKKFYAEKNKKRKVSGKVKKKRKQNTKIYKTEASEGAVVNNQNMCDITMSNMEYSLEDCATPVPVMEKTESDLEDGELKSDDDSLD